MSDRIREAVNGAVAGHTLGAPFEKRSGPQRVVFYDPVPSRMAPSHALEAWFLAAVGHPLDALRDPTVEAAFGSANRAIGLFGSVAGAFRNPHSERGGALARGLVWGLLNPAQPHVAAARAAVDASRDHAGDGVWCASALAAVATLSSDTPVSELLSTAGKMLPAESQGQRALHSVITNLGSTDAVKAVSAQVEGLCPAARLLAVCLVAVCSTNDFANAVIAAVGCGFEPAACGLITGSLAGIRTPATADWLAPLGDHFVSAHLPSTEQPPQTIDEFVSALEAAVNPPPLPDAPAAQAPSLLPNCLSSADLIVEYVTGPCVKPGESVQLIVRAIGSDQGPLPVSVIAPEGGTAACRDATLAAGGAAAAVVTPPEGAVSEATVTWGEHQLKVPCFPADSWFFAGPFANDDDMAYDKPCPAEKNLDANARFSGRSGLPAQWGPFSATSTRLDVEPLFASGPGVMALFARLSFPAPGPYSLVVAGAPGVVAFVDGVAVVKYKDAHVPDPLPAPPYIGKFETGGESQILIRLIRDRVPYSALTVYFLDALGQVVWPSFSQAMAP